MKIALITARLQRCGVGDYVLKLADALVAQGHQVTIITGQEQAPLAPPTQATIRAVLPNWQLAGMRALIKELSQNRPEHIFLQWVPFLYHYYGVNIWLPFTMLYLALNKHKITTMVHEPWVPFNTWKLCILGTLQRILLTILIFASSNVRVSIIEWTRMFKRYFFWRKEDIVWAPIGSNIDRYLTTKPIKAWADQQFHIEDSSFVITIFSPLGAGKGYDLLEASWATISAKFSDVKLLVIGATAKEARAVLPAIAEDKRVIFTGFLSNQEVSLCFQRSNLFLAPFTDGLTTRRTTALSAMLHGVPIISTRGHLYDREIFEDSPIIITDYSSEAFTKAALELLAHRERLPALNKETEIFFQKHFSWSKIINIFLS